jgi:dinuclear metal center YbgI/SA1388 family protein
MTTLSEILPVLETLAPLRYAESWDNVGLIVGDPSARVDKVLVTVDYSADVAEEARAIGASLVVAYHPPLFAAVKRVPHDALWADAIRRNVALYSMHTALDVALGGTNDVLADCCGVAPAGRRALRPFGAPPHLAERDPAVGLGRIGEVEAPSRRALVARVKERLGLAGVLVAGPLDAGVRKVAVAAGAGGELLEDAVRAGADVFVTGEVRHHDALAAARRGVTVVATLHSNSERVGVRAFGDRLRAALADVETVQSTRDADPFVLA